MMTKKPRDQGDRQLRVEDSFDRARHVNETSANRRQANRCKTDAVIPAGLKPVELPNTLNDTRFKPDEQDQSWKLFSACKPGEYPMPAPPARVHLGARISQ